MAWLPKKQAQTVAPRPAAPDTAKASFDVPIRIRLRGVNEPVQATLLHLAGGGGRLRTWMLMERGTSVSFDWQAGERTIRLAGTVAARYPARQGTTGFEYAVAFEPLPAADADVIARDAALLQRKSASARAYDTSLVDISGFTGFRVPAEFPAAYRTDDPRTGSRSGIAFDVNGSGMRLRCAEELRTGQVLNVQFRLPDGVLRVHTGSDDEMVVGPMGYRRMPLRYLRRPFEELRLKARVGAASAGQRQRVYDLAFLDVDGLAREELARYIHAAQLESLKKR